MGVPWYPVIIAAAMVLAAFVDVDVHVDALWRPLIVVALGTALLVAVITALTRNAHAAAAGATGMLIVARAGDVPHVLLAAVLLTTIGAALVVYSRLRSVRPSVASLTRGANTVSLILISGVLVTGILNGTALRSLADLQDPPPSGAASDSSPSIYLIVLDGYPRADTLERLFQHDNSSFLQLLEARGLSVASHSRSNYMYTELTFSSMLNMGHAPELLVREQSTRRLITENRLFEVLRDRGYRVFANATPWEGVALRGADQLCGDGAMTEFEFHLVRTSALLPLVLTVSPSMLAERWRSSVNTAFTCLDGSVAGEGPQLVFAHIPSPHLPIVFEADGSPAPVEIYSDTAHELEIPADRFGEAYVAQLRYLNDRVVDSVDRIISADEDALIVVMSDHGSESRFNWGDARLSDLEERFSNLFAARTPGHSCLFGAAPTPVNLFPRLLNEYHGTNFELVPDRTYISTAQAKLDLELVPSPDVGGGSC